MPQVPETDNKGNYCLVSDNPPTHLHHVPSSTDNSTNTTIPCLWYLYTKGVAEVPTSSPSTNIVHLDFEFVTGFTYS
jgi:hypothetical protein